MSSAIGSELNRVRRSSKSSDGKIREIHEEEAVRWPIERTAHTPSEFANIHLHIPGN